MSGGRTVTLSWDGGGVEIRGDRPSERGLYVTGDGIEGWDSAPDAKVTMTEMQTGDGAHAVRGQDVLYAARTVTVHFGARGRSRDDVVSLLRSISAACHRIVRLRVRDGGEDTWCEGYAQPSVDAEWRDDHAAGTLTVVCPDPRRYSTAARRAVLMPTASSPGGLSYGADGAGLVYGLSYGETPETLQGVATLANAGTSPAYPIITLNGPIEGGARVDWDGGSVGYSEPVGGVPVTLDSLTRTASVGGLDVSRHLTSRGFPSVPAGGSITLSAQMVGTGWADVEWRDTYI